MPLTQLSLDNMNSPYAEQLAKGFSHLRFSSVLEKEFREFYVDQSLPRGRLSGLIGLIIAFAASAFDLLLGNVSSVESITIIRLGLLCPVLAMMVVAIYLPALAKHYSQIAGIGVLAVGLIVTYMCILAANNGASYVLGGALLVNLYACMFLGLLFYIAASIAGVLIAAFMIMGALGGLATDELFYSAAILGTASTIGIVAAYNLERAIRRSFLETRLLNELAERDGLTGLYNRRIFDSFMRRVWRQSRREETTVQIILIDIDHFKIYNDLYGHQVGDDTLKRVAQCISVRAKRPFDFCARYGGEEFVLVLYGPPPEYAQSVPEMIRQDVIDLAIEHEGSTVSNLVTVSIGVATARPGSGRSLAGAIQAADEALYLAKKRGRNTIVCRDANIDEVETGRFRNAYSEMA